jgi:hypothetical protein
MSGSGGSAFVTSSGTVVGADGLHVRLMCVNRRVSPSLQGQPGHQIELSH